MTESKFISILLLIAIVAVLSGCATESWLAVGHKEMNKGNYSRAIECYKNAIIEDDWCSERLGSCQCCLCEAYYKNGQPADAYEACKKALNILPINEPESCWDTAWKLGLKENVINSIKGHNLHAASWSVSLQQWIVGPDGFNIQLSYYSNELGRYDDAIVAAKREIEVRPNNYVAFVNLGVAYKGKKQYDDAIAAVKRSIEIKPNDFAYKTLATIYTAKKQYDDAIAAYKKAIELDPKNISNYFELSNCYVAKEDYVSAIAITERAQELAPDNADIPFAIGSFYMRMGKFDEAISSLNKAISLRTMTGVGIQIAIEGNYPVVKSVMEGPAKKAGMEVGDKIIKINGQSTKGWAINKVSQAVKGAEGTQVVLAIERKNLDNLIEKTVTRETIIEKSAAPIFGLRSLAYRTRGNTEDAEKDAEKAYSLDPNNDGAKGALGAIYLDKGKYDDTIKILSNTSKDNYFARILEATAYAKTSGYKKAVQIYSSIPEDYLISTNALRQRYKGAILEALTPYADAKKDSAKSLAAKGQYKEALKEYAEALKIADDNDAKKIRNNIAGLIKKNPYLAELPEEGRRYAIRAEASTKEGKFEDAVKEYKEAIKVAPYFPALYKAIALNYAELKEYRQAINNLKIYLDLSPDAPDARAVKDNIYKWEFLMEKGGK